MNITTPIINTPDAIRIMAQMGNFFSSSSSSGSYVAVIVIFRLRLTFEMELCRFNLMTSLTYSSAEVVQT